MLAVSGAWALMDVCVETARLKLVPSTRRWRNELFALFNDPEVADWLFLTGPPTREQLDRRIEIHEIDWHARGFGMFVVLEKSTDRFVARVGAMETPETGRIEIAWSTVHDAWGRGYASEAASAAISHTFRHSKLEALDCYLRADNTGSRRVAEKAGFKYQDTRFLYDRPLRYYKLPRP